MESILLSGLILLLVLSEGSKILVTKPWVAGEESRSDGQTEGVVVRGKRRDLEGSQSVILTAHQQNSCPRICPGCKHFDPRECRAGVSFVKDGCGCCDMCARQQGDLCDVTDVCDVKKGLYCDFTQRKAEGGICRAKLARKCEHRGAEYRDGDFFRPACSELCLCQNGQVTCSTSCPHEYRRPSSRHCRHPRLVSITGRCCKEWVCPHSFSLPEPETPEPSPPACKADTSQWSHCSKSCGVGRSYRHSNSNPRCKLKQEQRLCFVRPCDMNDKHLTDTACHRSWPEEGGRRIYDPMSGCTSTEKHFLEFCSTCKRNKCCKPDTTKTKEIDFRCPGGGIVTEKFMWIKSCVCVRKSKCPFK